MIIVVVGVAYVVSRCRRRLCGGRRSSVLVASRLPVKLKRKGKESSAIREIAFLHIMYGKLISTEIENLNSLPPTQARIPENFFLK